MQVKRRWPPEARTLQGHTYYGEPTMKITTIYHRDTSQVELKITPENGAEKYILTLLSHNRCKLVLHDYQVLTIHLVQQGQLDKEEATQEIENLLKS